MPFSPAWRAWRSSPGRETAGVNGLLWVYLLGGILEIGGILYTAKIGLKVVNFGGLGRVWYPEAWQVRLALGLVLSGVVVSLGGNLLSLYVK
jgi:hypothetical protein